MRVYFHQIHVSWLQLLCLVSNIKCLCRGEKGWKCLITFHVAYMNSKQTWSLADGYCQFKAKFRTLMIEETLSTMNFRFVAKIHWKSVLCSDEMSLNRPWTFDRIFVRTFDERSLEQITKFAEFRLHYFCTILYKENLFLIKTFWALTSAEWVMENNKHPPWLSTLLPINASLFSQNFLNKQQGIYSREYHNPGVAWCKCPKKNLSYAHDIYPPKLLLVVHCNSLETRN